MKLLEDDFSITIIFALLGIIGTFIVYIFNNNIIKKIEELSTDVKNSEKNRKVEIDDLENVVSKKIDDFERTFTKKIDKIEDEIKLNKLDLNHKFDKYDMEMRMMNKELIILQNEQKHLNKKLNKVDGIDSTEY